MESASPFYTQVCTDLKKISTKEGKTKYAIHEKLFEEFTGYLPDKETGKIIMVSGKVKVLKPIYGYNTGLRSLDTHLVEDMMDGQYPIHKRWALIEDIFNDYDMTKQLLKYFLSHQAPRELWVDAYYKAYDLLSMPHENITWHGKEDL